MAFVTRITCSECDSQWIGPVNPFGPNVCATCLQTTLDKAEKTYFDKLEGLSIEERLTKIEKWIYKHGAHKTGLSDLKYY